MNSSEINPKIKANAVVSYFMIFVSLAFLLNKKNTLINNSFVKSHTKVAFIIHLLFLINYIVFIIYWLGFNFSILNYDLNHILASSIFIFIFWLLMMWVYKAHKWEIFKLWETIKIKKLEKNVININSNHKISEKAKLTIILSKVPFVWFFISAKYKKNKIIQNNVKLNLIVTLIISILYIFWNWNLSTLILLLYIIFTVFLSINLAVKNEVINFHLEKVPSVNNIKLHFKTTCIYMWKYFAWKNFKTYKEIFTKLFSNEIFELKKEEQKLEKLKGFRLPLTIIYIPVLNIISIFNLKSKQKKHIINGLIITTLFISSWFLFWINNKYQLLIVFPLIFAFWNLKINLTYEIPFLYDIYKIFAFIYLKLKKLLLFLKKKKKEVKEVKLKTNEIKKTEEKKVEK